MTPRDLEGRLRLARERIAAGRHRSARDLADRALVEARRSGAHAVLAALTAWDLGLSGASAQLAAALEKGSEDVPRADRVAGWVAVAEDADQGHHWREADAAWSRAIEAAGTESAQVSSLFLARGAGLLRHGRTEDALPHLCQAMGASDTVVALAACLLVSALRLAAGELEEARETAQRAQAIAVERHNWLAHAAATIDLSEILTRTEGVEAAQACLVEALVLCRSRGDPGALLMARAYELTQAE